MWIFSYGTAIGDQLIKKKDFTLWIWVVDFYILDRFF